MRPFGWLLGRNFANAAGGSGAPLSPSYNRLHRWIESKIGPVNPADPNTKSRMEALLKGEKARFPSVRGSVTITQRGSDTIVSGNTKPIKGRLHSMGLEWDRKTKSWIGRNMVLSESDIDVPGELAGLMRYIESGSYRSKF